VSNLQTFISYLTFIIIFHHLTFNSIISLQHTLHNDSSDLKALRLIFTSCHDL